MYLTSRSVLSLNARAVMPMMTPVKMAVFTFQFAGCVYQPPAGDQTCLGYLVEEKGGQNAIRVAASKCMGMARLKLTEL